MLLLISVETAFSIMWLSIKIKWTIGLKGTGEQEYLTQEKWYAITVHSCITMPKMVEQYSTKENYI